MLPAVTASMEQAFREKKNSLASGGRWRAFLGGEPAMWNGWCCKRLAWGCLVAKGTHRDRGSDSRRERARKA